MCQGTDCCVSSSLELLDHPSCLFHTFFCIVPCAVVTTQCAYIERDTLRLEEEIESVRSSRYLLFVLQIGTQFARMARHENPFDMQIKLLMIGDSGACNALSSQRSVSYDVHRELWT